MIKDIMKIAMMVRSLLTTPVPTDIGYSPATIAQQVAEGLQARGHEVTFFGPEGTSLDVARIETCGIKPRVTNQKQFDDFLEDPDLFDKYLAALDDSVLVQAMLEGARNGEFDCVMFNHFESALGVAKNFPDVPIIHILHDFIDDSRREVLYRHATPNQYFVSISDNQRQNAPELNYAGTVYNGIDIDQFSFNSEPGDYLFFSGRLTPDKGVKEAISVARATKRQLLIAGSLSKAHYGYFDEYVKPYLDDQILYLGLLDKAQLTKYYRRASALLVPIQWQEPFGLTMAEANACGTPVIAYRKGSVPEVIEDSYNGLIVDNEAEMVMAVKQIPTIKRENCRKHVEKKFTLENMAKGYETVLQKVVDEFKSSSNKPARKKVSP